MRPGDEKANCRLELTLSNLELGDALFRHVGYRFAPAVHTGAMYSGAPTARSPLRPPIPIRAGLGGICGGVIGAVWLHAVMHVSSHDYEFAAALVAAALSLRPATSRN